MARILLHDDTNTNPDAGIVLLSYQSCILLPYESNKPVPIRIRTDKPRCRYAYETTPITRRADTPVTRTRLGRASLPRTPNLSLILYYYPDLNR